MTASTTRPRLLLRGDDAGATRGTNEALLVCARTGLLRNIGLMACTPAFDHAVELFHDLPADVALGLHATVTSEWTSSLRWGPVLPREHVPTLLASDGNFVRSTKTLHEQADHDQIIAEVRAQIAKARSTGLRLTYLDTHMVFNWLPGMQARLEALAAAENLVLDVPSGSPVQSLPAAPLTTLLDRIAALPDRGTFRVVFHPSELDPDSLLMIGDTADDTVARQRAAETEFLTTPETAIRLRELGVNLVTYRDLDAPHPASPHHGQN
jgi:predicted glycoside hydrolase/deacetylase ChbG (UPF0249 family)